VAVTDPCALLTRLLREHEKEWLEFKLNRADPVELGEYVSALANSAMLADRDKAYLVFGIEDATRKKVGTQVRLRSLKKGGENFVNWLQRKLDPALMIEYLDFECDGLAFAIMCIEPSYDRPVKFDEVAYIVSVPLGLRQLRLDEVGLRGRRFASPVAACSMAAAQRAG
jgi:predicted HTH transcriptional regulator